MAGPGGGEGQEDVVEAGLPGADAPWRATQLLEAVEQLDELGGCPVGGHLDGSEPGVRVCGVEHGRREVVGDTVRELEPDRLRGEAAL